MTEDPIDATIDALTRESAGAPGTTRQVVVAAGALDACVVWAEAHHGGAADLVVSDPNTRAAAGEQLIGRLRARGRTVRELVLEPHAGDEYVVCDDETIARAQARLRELPSANAIAVGAGTINDIVKMATSKLERPYQSVATAASMNGYTSAIAAVLSRGVKRTLPTRQAEAVFADVDVIRRAPSHLNQAGFGDLLSKPYSHADWLLSHLVRGEPYAARPATLLDDAYELLLSRAVALGRAEPEAVATLTRTIMLSGFTMAIAGTSSPASGGEHLVSHYWDMEQHCAHAPLFGLHGTQVGIATRLSAMLFERLLALEADAIDATRAARHMPEVLSRLGSLHPRLSAPVVEEVRAQLEAKQRLGADAQAEIEAVRERWDEIRARLRAVLEPAATIGSALQSVGAPCRPSDIGVDRDHAIHTLRVCRHIRSRYVGLDLIDDLGLLHDWAPLVVDAAEG